MADNKDRVLVLGWYNKGNLGDESFKGSFAQLWPQKEFIFLDRVPEDLGPYSACLIGGGSFLDANFMGADRLVGSSIPLAFVGVGVGTKISPIFQKLLPQASAVVVRDFRSAKLLPPSVDRSKVKVATDLFYVREDLPPWTGHGSGKVLVSLSEHFMPRPNAPDWFNNAWPEFTINLAAVLDILQERGMTIEFLPFSVYKHDDRRAAESVVALMQSTRSVCLSDEALPESAVLAKIASAELVLSLRLHGMIFASAVGCPFLALCGHDKAHFLAETMNWPQKLDFYRPYWRRMLALADQALTSDPQELNPSKQEARKRWDAASEYLTTRLWP